MMEISKVNEFGSFQTNYKAALCPVPVRKVWQEFGGRAGKPPGFPLAKAWPPPFSPPHHLTKMRIIYGQDLKLSPVAMVASCEHAGPPQNWHECQRCQAQQPRPGGSAWELEVRQAGHGGSSLPNSHTNKHSQLT